VVDRKVTLLLRVMGVSMAVVVAEREILVTPLQVLGRKASS